MTDDDDMASVGRALMDTIDANIDQKPLKGWAPAQCPSEIVGDLLNMIDERDAEIERLRRSGGERAQSDFDADAEKIDREAWRKGYTAAITSVTLAAKERNVEGWAALIATYSNLAKAAGGGERAAVVPEDSALRLATQPSDEVIEAVARAICADLGDLPDSPGVLIRGREGERPNWEGYETTARAAILSHQKTTGGDPRDEATPNSTSVDPEAVKAARKALDEAECIVDPMEYPESFAMIQSANKRLRATGEIQDE